MRYLNHLREYIMCVWIHKTFNRSEWRPMSGARQFFLNPIKFYQAEAEHRYWIKVARSRKKIYAAQAKYAATSPFSLANRPAFPDQKSKTK